MQLAGRLAEMPPEEFAAQVEELAQAKLEKPKRLREAAGRDWSEIDHGLLRWAAGAALGVVGGALPRLLYCQQWLLFCPALPGRRSLPSPPAHRGLDLKTTGAEGTSLPPCPCNACPAYLQV